MVFFIKYEYWLNYLNRLNTQSTPTYLISEYLENNKCSKWYGGFTKALDTLPTFAERRIKIVVTATRKTNVAVSGDTRLTELPLF
jgi:3-deoxy-D-manno-octulosonic-acid transferase